MLAESIDWRMEMVPTIRTAVTLAYSEQFYQSKYTQGSDKLEL